MARYIGHVTSPRPIEDVFDYLADFSNVRDWDPSAVESRALNGGGVAEGSRYAVISRFLGREVPITYEVTEIERPARVALLGENDSVVSLDTMSFRERPDGGTEVTYDADLQLQGARRLLDPVVGLFFRRLCERARVRMEEVLGA